MTEFTARGSGYYRVYLDGVQVSQHVAEREALESLTNVKRDNPDSEVYVDHDYRVDVELDEAVEIPEPPVPEPLPGDLPAPVITDVEVFEDRIVVNHTHHGDYDNVEYAIKTRAHLGDEVSPFSNEVLVMGIGENAGEHSGENTGSGSSASILPLATNVQVTNITSDGCVVTWELPYHGSATLVKVYASGPTTISIDVTDLNTTTATFTTLTPNTNYDITVQTLNQSNNTSKTTAAVNIDTLSVATPPTWTPFSLPTVIVGSGWSINLNNYVNDNGSPITGFSTSGGALPAGISLNSNGTFTGVASVVTGGAVVFQATNAAGTTGSGSKSWTVNAAGTSPLPTTFTRMVTFENPIDGGVNGTSCVDKDYGYVDPDNFDGHSTAAGTNTKCLYSDTHAFNLGNVSRSRAALLTSLAGSQTSLGNRPGIHWDTDGPSPTGTMNVGDEVWMQWRIWVGQNFLNAGGATQGNGSKYLRWTLVNSSGFDSLYLWPTVSTFGDGQARYHTAIDGTFPKINWGLHTSRSGLLTDYGKIQPNRWTTNEVYIKIDNQDTLHGGTGVTRLWVDHVPMNGWYNQTNPGGGSGNYLSIASTEIPFTALVSGATAYIGYAPFFGQFNTQNTNIDDVWLAEFVCCYKGGSINDTPDEIDSTGFPYIGPWENN